MPGASVPGRLILKEPGSVAPMSKVPMPWVPMPLAPMSRAPRLRVPPFRWAAQLLVPPASRSIRPAMRGLLVTPSRSSGAIRVCHPGARRDVRRGRPRDNPGQGGPQPDGPQQRGPQPGAQPQRDPRQSSAQGMPLRPDPEAHRARIRIRPPAPEASARPNPPAVRSAGPLNAPAAGRGLMSGAARLRRFSRTVRCSIAARYSMKVPGCLNGVDSMPDETIFSVSGREYRYNPLLRSDKAFSLESGVFPNAVPGIFFDSAAIL